MEAVTILHRAGVWLADKWGNTAAILTGVALLITTGQAVGIVSPAMPVLWYQLNDALSSRDAPFDQLTLNLLDIAEAVYDDQEAAVDARLQDAPGDSLALSRKRDLASKLSKIGDARRSAECELARAQGNSCNP